MKIKWIKSMLVTLLCTGVLLAACACDTYDKDKITDQPTTTTTPSENTPAPSDGAARFDNYTQILTTFRSMLQHRILEGFDGLDELPRPEYADEQAQNIGGNLLSLAYNVNPEKMCYANQDLDENRLSPVPPNSLSGDTWSTNRNPTSPDTKSVTMKYKGGDWFVSFTFPTSEKTPDDASIQFGENRFAEECSFATDGISGTLSFGNHSLWLTVEASEFDELPVGTYLLYDRYYYDGK